MPVPGRVAHLSDSDAERPPSTQRVARSQMKRGMSRVSKLSHNDETMDIIIAPPLQKKLHGPMDAKRPFVEVFEGSCHLANAFQHAGHRVYSMDIKLNIMMDMSGVRGWENFLKMAKELEGRRASNHMSTLRHPAPHSARRAARRSGGAATQAAYHRRS